MLLRRGDHRLEPGPVVLLDVGLARQLDPGVAQAQGERVAHPLELAGREHPRAADCPDVPLEPAARERGGEELAERALQPADLAAQVLAGPTLRGLNRGLVWRLDETCRHDRLAVFEHFGHFHSYGPVADAPDSNPEDLGDSNPGGSRRPATTPPRPRSEARPPP